MDFAERFDKYLKGKNISNYRMAQDTNISDSLIGYWRRGKMKPSIENLVTISHYLEVSLDFLILGKNSAPIDVKNKNYIQFQSTSQKIDYKNKVLHLKDDTFSARFKEAREAAEISLEDAASGAFLSVDDLRLLEDGPSLLDIDAYLKKVRDIGWEQLSYLAYKYNVDLFWLLCGKVRPPATIVQNGKLVFPPYEFMMDTSQAANSPAAESAPEAAPKVSPNAADYSDLAARWDAMVQAAEDGTPSDDDFDNLYPGDPEYNLNIPWVASGGAHLDKEKYDKLQQGLRLFEKRIRLTEEQNPSKKNGENKE